MPCQNGRHYRRRTNNSQPRYGMHRHCCGRALCRRIRGAGIQTKGGISLAQTP